MRQLIEGKYLVIIAVSACLLLVGAGSSFAGEKYKNGSAILRVHNPKQIQCKKSYGFSVTKIGRDIIWESNKRHRGEETKGRRIVKPLKGYQYDRVAAKKLGGQKHPSSSLTSVK